MFAKFLRATAKPAFAFAIASAVAGSVMGMTATGASATEIVITVTKFHALDRADELSSGDFFARMKINGKAAFSPTITGEQVFTPDWKLALQSRDA